MEMNDYSALVDVMTLVIRLAVWGVVGYVMGKKAKDVGLSFGVYFTLTFLLGVIGLVISIIKINNRKKQLALMNLNVYQQNPYNNAANPYANQQNPYQNAQNPYQAGQNPYQNGATTANPYANQQNPYQQNAYQQQAQQPYQQSAYNTPYNNTNTTQGYDNSNPAGFGLTFTCKECGNVQNTGGFCKVCGAKL